MAGERMSEPEISRRSGAHGILLGKCAASEKSHCVSGNEVALNVEGVVDRCVGGNEALSLALRLEPLHLLLSSSDRQV